MATGLAAKLSSLTLLAGGKIEADYEKRSWIMKNSLCLLWLTLVVVLIGTVGTPLVSGGPLPVFQSASAVANPSESSSSSAAGLGEWKSRLIFAEPLDVGGVRFVFAVPAAEEFGIEETPDLLGETWRPLPEDEFKMIREENNVNE